MGAWGINTFENDGAMDWLGDFLDDPSEKRLIDTFSPEPTVIQPGFVGKLMGKKPETISTELEGEEVLAAAEVVATISGRPSTSNPDELNKLPSISIQPETITKALAAVEAIMAESNLKDCWEGTEDFENWKATVDDLCERLRKQ